VRATVAFFLKPSTDKVKHHESFYFTQHGSDPEAAYALTSVDPASQAAKNTYAVALFDSHNPDILYGEVLSKPGWSQPSLSQDEIRRNGGVVPPPQPIFPTEFAIQLYNPDQQVIVKQQAAKWGGTPSYEFSMPQTTFRTPSASVLDRSQNDPGADASTPQINFAWRREGRLGKDMTCYLTGKSTDPTGKKAKKHREPDIAIAMFTGLKEMTILESNLHRVDMEDYKGLEVIIMLSGAVIRDLFFTSQKEAYHIIDSYSRKNSGGLRTRKGSSPLEPSGITPPVMTPRPAPQQQQQQQQPQQAQRPSQSPAHPHGLYNLPSRNDAKRSSLSPLQTGSGATPRLDPRSQWEIDQETERLKAQVEAEAREQKRKAEMVRKQQAEEEARKTRQFLQDEERKRQEAEKQQRRRQAEVDKETERLRRQFGDQSNLLRPSPPGQPQQRHSSPHLQGQGQHRHSPSAPSVPAQSSHSHRPSGPYLQAPGQRPSASQSTFFSNGLAKPDAQQKMKKKSFWGLRSSSESNNTLKKKQSSMF